MPLPRPYPSYLREISQALTSNFFVTVSKSGKVNKEIFLPMMVKVLLFNSFNMSVNWEVTGTRSVREHGSVDEEELNSPSAMISSSETS